MCCSDGLSELTLDELADGICLRAGRIAAAQAELLPWIAEFDRREGWGGTGLLSCAHWLSWPIGLSLSTARDQVRVAHRLEELPALHPPHPARDGAGQRNGLMVLESATRSRRRASPIA